MEASTGITDTGIIDYHLMKGWIEGVNPKTTLSGETVEKVPKQILGWDAEKNDLTECATINDLVIMGGMRPPKTTH